MKQTEYETAINTVIDGLGYTVHWPNVDFEPDNTAYLKVDYLEARSEANTFGSDRIPALVQVSVYQPVGGGSIASGTMADAVRAAFTKDSEFTSGTTTVRVDQSPYLAPKFTNDSWFITPVTIPFEVYL